MGPFKRLVVCAGALGTLSIGLAGSSAALGVTAIAAGGGGCGGSGGSGGTSGPTQVFASHFTGISASASYTSVVGTTETDIGVDAFHGTATLAATGPGSIDAVFVTIFVFDTESGLQSVAAFGCVPSPNFQIDQTLTSATLAPTTVTLVDFNTNASSTVTVSAGWTGFGPETRQTQVSHFHSGGFTTTFNFVGFDRFANATGSVIDPDLNVSAAGAASFAELDKVEAGGVFVCLAGAC